MGAEQAELATSSAESEWSADILPYPGDDSVSAGTAVDLRGAEPIVHLPTATKHRGAEDAKRWQLIVKRSLDLVVSTIALILLIPLFIVTAIAVKVSSRGPAFYVRDRVGKDGEQFGFIKFRTMSVNAEYEKPALQEFNVMGEGPVFKMKDDPRSTKVGKVLRKLSIDELPQLIHVFTGRMSLVGPRPHLVEEVAAYGEHHRRRLNVKPGVTCYWQVSGRCDLDFETWVNLDLQYINDFSLWLDVKLLAKTPTRGPQGQGCVLILRQAVSDHDGAGQVS